MSSEQRMDPQQLSAMQRTVLALFHSVRSEDLTSSITQLKLYQLHLKQTCPCLPQPA